MLLLALTFLVLAAIGYFAVDQSGGAVTAAVAGIAIIVVVKINGKGTQ